MEGFTRTVAGFTEIIEPLVGHEKDDVPYETWLSAEDKEFPTIQEISDAARHLPPIESDTPRLLEIPDNRPKVLLQDGLESLRREEADLNGWPRRLLHVPTLTSHEWTPGNVYGGVVEPVYNAITYTWGRWKLDQTDESTQALEISNVSWDVPKVDPSHFTISEFLQALQCATSSATKPSESWQSYRPVEFIWLDVACISQNIADPRSAAEIGRQAQIFRGAQAVFVWLTTLNHVYLENVLTRLYRDVMSGRSQEPRSLVPDTATLAFGDMTRILADPWFSSLWTLQEAFLRSDALFMARDGHIPYLERHYETQQGDLAPYMTPVDLTEFVEYGEKLRSLPAECSSRSSSESVVTLMKGLYDEITLLVRSRGLLALYTCSPLATFTAASTRETKYPEDRIYGIQQIFNFRLGSSAIEHTSAIEPSVDGEYSAASLQDQLGEQLMLNYPVHSQMHVYTAPVALGKGWRVNEDSVVPGAEEGTGLTWDHKESSYPDGPAAWPDDEEQFRKLCRLDIAFVEGGVWGQFEAMTCLFATFNSALKQYEADCIMSRAYDAEPGNTFLHIWPDVTAELKASPGYVGRGYHPVPRRQQRTFAQWIDDHLSEHQLRILILGRETFRAQNGGNLLGLLIVEKKSGQLIYWHRIGICRWMSTQLTFLGQAHSMRPFFEGLDEDWVLTRGLLG